MSSNLVDSAVAYVKMLLGGLTAIFLALIIPGAGNALQSISQEKATGAAVLPFVLLEAVLSPGFWILGVVFFALFSAAGRLQNKALRVLLFWAPTLLVSTLGLGLIALIGYLVLRFRQG